MWLALWVLASWTVTSPCAVQILTCRCSCSSSGRIVRCACQFYGEPVHGHRTARGTRLGRQCVSGCSLCHFSCQLFFCSQGGRPARCFNVSCAHFPSDPSVLHLGMFVLEEVFVCWLASPVVVCFMAKLVFRSVDELISHGKVSCEQSASRAGSLLFSPKLLPAHSPNVHCALSTVS